MKTDFETTAIQRIDYVPREMAVTMILAAVVSKSIFMQSNRHMYFAAALGSDNESAGGSSGAENKIGFGVEIMMGRK